MVYMLDTDTSSYIIRGGYGPIEQRLETVGPDGICISAMTRAELLYGLKRLPTTHRLHRAVPRFLQATRTLAWEGEAAAFYSEIKHQLTTEGAPIGELDMLIAAHSIAVDAVLVTNNTRHFKRIKLPLMLENWLE